MSRSVRFLRPSQMRSNQALHQTAQTAYAPHDNMTTDHRLQTMRALARRGLSCVSLVGERFTAYQRSAQAVQSDRGEIFAARAAVVSAANSRVQVEGYGVTVKELVTAVPSGFLIMIGPLVAEGGTVAVIWVEVSMVNFVARTPLKVTLEVPARNRPLNTTAVLTGPLAGENCVSRGGEDVKR
jgi:hypothetical protein